MLSKVFLLTHIIFTTIGAQAWLKKVDSYSLKYFSTTCATVHSYTRVKIFVELALGRKRARKEQELEVEAEISSISGLKCRLKVRPKRLNFFFKETKAVAWQIFKKKWLVTILSFSLSWVILSSFFDMFVFAVARIVKLGGCPINQRQRVQSD